MNWYVVSIPSSVRDFLRKNRPGDFSTVQKLAAAIRLYTALPLHDRIRLAREYVARRRAGRETYPADPPGHDYPGATSETS
jgi:hypothetical protein